MTYLTLKASMCKIVNLASIITPKLRTIGNVKPGDTPVYTDGEETISKQVRQVIHQPNWQETRNQLW